MWDAFRFRGPMKTRKGRQWADVLFARSTDFFSFFPLFFSFFFIESCLRWSFFFSLFSFVFFFFFTIFHNGNRNRLNRMALFFLFAFSKCTIMLSWFIEPCEKNTISVRKSVIKQFLPLVHPFVHSISWKNRSHWIIIEIVK